MLRSKLGAFATIGNSLIKKIDRSHRLSNSLKSAAFRHLICRGILIGDPVSVVKIDAPRWHCTGLKSNALANECELLS